MGLRKILTDKEPALHKVCKPVTSFDQKLHKLLDDMVETLIDSGGVGLAAPQVGIMRRVCVVCTNGKDVYELVNPVLVKSKGKQVGPEGCLSVPDRQGIVERPMYVTVEAYDRTGKKYRYNAEGFVARAFCHEMDHLDGILYVDKMVRED